MSDLTLGVIQRLRLNADLGIWYCGCGADLTFDVAQCPGGIQRNTARIAHDTTTVVTCTLSQEFQVFASAQRACGVEHSAFGIDGERLGATNRAAGVIKTLGIQLQISLDIERA